MIGRSAKVRWNKVESSLGLNSYDFLLIRERFICLYDDEIIFRQRVSLDKKLNHFAAISI